MSNKVAIVTGASGGIGQEIVYALVNAGIKVTMVARNIDKLIHIAGALADKKNMVLSLKADLCNVDEIINVVSLSHRHWGQTDILINNAACCSYTSFHSGEKEDWQRMWQLNVFAPSVAIQETLKYFDKDNGGHIINISSMSAHRVVRGGCFYSVTKAALNALTETLRKELVELKSKTRVSSISPGLVNTSFCKKDQGALQTNSGKETLDPQDVAEAVLYLINTKPHVAVHDILLRSINQYE
ncbi:MAG: Short-chain dehydrogenase/reductase [Burkholderiales bacterium]|jgi:NADP-dependent 3-hydroxy acid dehydrogenase YdfG|nr:Short-chain dehydrogenase/reductase [Burkholderiales bacterium]